MDQQWTVVRGDHRSVRDTNVEELDELLCATKRDPRIVAYNAAVP